jgi:ribonuclease P protein component
VARSKLTRLTDSLEFERAYRQGTSYRGRLLSVHAFPNEIDIPRLGLSVSKKVGNAVTRNAVRRRLKEVFHLTIERIPGSFDLVVSAKRGAGEASFEELNQEFLRALGKIGGSDKRRKV